MESPPPQLSIRPATRADLYWCSQHDYAGAKRLSTAVDDGRVLLALDGSEIVGMLRGTWLHDVTPMLALVYVAPAARQLGFARQMLSRWCAHLSGEGYSFCLSSGTAGEELSARWHSACGFERCGAIEGLNHDGADELLYRLNFE